MKSHVRRLILLLAAAAVAGVIGYGLWPAPVEADLAKVVRGSIRETVDEDGKTRIHERYIVSAPLAGRLMRIELDPGDPVEAGQTVLARIEPRDPELLDARAVMQAEANVKAAEAKLKQMVPVVEEAVAAQEYSEGELRRVREIHTKNPQAISESEVENKLMEFRMRSAVVRSQQHNQEIAQFELDQARAALLRSRPPAPPVAQAADQTSGGDVVSTAELDAESHFVIHSPITGRVFRVFQQSSSVVTAGTNLLEIGDPRDLEVEIDVLSRDAVRVTPGAPVLLEHWGGDKPLHGSVRLVEPSAFTKISTLGVEEQRVNVIVDLLDPPQDRPTLGDGFRVEARIVIAEAADVLKTPTSALFRVGDQWAVFRVDAGVARQQIVKLGLQNGLEAQVLEGLAEGNQVVTHPGDNIADGKAVVAR